MPKIGVIFSGCGVFDGTEITEAVMTLYFLEKKGADIVCMAPNIEQYHVVNHLTGDVDESKKRNVLEEAARLVRGNVKDISDVDINELDALVIPGGFGAAKNLTTYAIEGNDCKVNEDVKKAVNTIVTSKKPMAAICIAPVLVAKALEGTGIKSKITIGSDENVAGSIESFGATHVECPVKEALVDEENKIITTPAFMLAQNTLEVAAGIEKTIENLYRFL
ncbi:isoprenoid biosynthesis glyoxalase ElbB [Flexistipes sp.]|uniref:isoprenoid biosynthesis glyoxalase ElbB n=1 Tax=Flexistipes sp. TaxID=3088135 RepID=UPI002E204141|nr:isoprenoid biosynthesis glyoxalase ElbB [Flexistipes sp.]